MSGFSAEWLALREPVDQKARNRDLLAAVKAHFRDRDHVTVTDLACGRGALQRALTGRLPRPQLWNLVDYDAALLAEATAVPRSDVRSAPHLADLAADIEAIVAIPADLVATTAFVDLVSEAWLTRFIDSVAAHRRPVYLGLSYDGRMMCEPHHPSDAAALAAFNRHQRTDKGFGPALGPDASSVATRLLAAHGYHVMTGQSDWRLGAQHGDLQRAMLDGWRSAAQEVGGVAHDELAAWHANHVACIAQGQGTMVVGHIDLWAVP